MKGTYKVYRTHKSNKTYSTIEYNDVVL